MEQMGIWDSSQIGVLLLYSLQANRQDLILQKWLMGTFNLRFPIHKYSILSLNMPLIDMYEML